MSEETTRRLAEAREAEQAASEVASTQIQGTLNAVADGMVGRLEMYAKRLTHQQPRVAKRLGKDGVTALRADLAAAVEEIAADLREAAEDIGWPITPHVRPQEVHSALFKYLYDTPMSEELTSIFVTHGFAFDSTQSVLPQDLYDQHDFGDLPAALTGLANASAARARAAADDDRDQVESLWDQ